MQIEPKPVIRAKKSTARTKIYMKQQIGRFKLSFNEKCIPTFNTILIILSSSF